MARLCGMDIWRGLLLSLGVFVHCAALAEIPAFDVFEEASHLFRMAAFFAISGFFAAMTIRKGRASAWLGRRAVMLGVPLVFGLLVLNPASHRLIDEIRAAPGFMAGYRPWHPSDWHMHLWFLVAMLLYTPFAVLFHRFEGRGMRAGDAVLRHRWLALALFCLAGTAVLVGMHLLGGVLGNRFLLRQTGYYALFYTLGYWLFAHEGMRAWFLRLPAWLHLLAAAGALADLALVATGADGRLQYAVIFAVSPLVALCATSLIFAHALSVKGEHPFGMKVANAAYTIYLLHVLFILALVWLFYPVLNWSVALGPYLAFFVIAPLVIVTLFVLHTRVVARVPLLSFLINGRWAARGGGAKLAPGRARG